MQLQLQEQQARLIATYEALDKMQDLAEQLQTQFQSIREECQAAEYRAKQVVRFHELDD